MVKKPVIRIGYCYDSPAIARDYTPRAANSTSSACPATRTFGQIRTMRPVASIRSVLRMTPMYSPVHRFLAPGPIGCQHVFGFIGPERDSQLMFGFELVLGRYRVGGNPENRRIGLSEIGAEPRECNRLRGTARRVSFRIEIKDEVSAFEILQRNFAAAISGQGEGRSLRARNKFSPHMPSFRRFQAVMSHMPFASEGRNGFHRYVP
jgi:hypothetical protein